MALPYNIQQYPHQFLHFIGLCLFIYLLVVIKNTINEKNILKQQVEQMRCVLTGQAFLLKAHLDTGAFNEALQKIADYFQADEVFFYLKENYAVEEKCLWQNKCSRLKNDIQPLAKKVYSVLSTSGRNRILYDVKADKDDFSLPHLNGYKLSKLLAVPIRDNNRNMIGVLCCCNGVKKLSQIRFMNSAAGGIFRSINNYNGYYSVVRKAQYDTLTGLKNQNNYYAALYELSLIEMKSFACIYIDVNGLHEINNHLGHKAGDTMLREVAQALRSYFDAANIYRIGGDEFVVLCKNKRREDITAAIRQAQADIRLLDYEISIGVEWRDRHINVKDVVNAAEQTMLKNKRSYYEHNKGKGQMRTLNEKMEKIIMEKDDMTKFLRVLSSHFMGVYFVDLASDSIRHIYIPPYFAEMLAQCDGRYKDALLLYARELVKPFYYDRFKDITDYNHLEQRIKDGNIPEFTYEKLNGEWVRLQIMKINKNDGNPAVKETLWIFSRVD